MPVTGKPEIPYPFISGFCFVACQRGASEYQTAEVAGSVKPRWIFHSNRDIQQKLAFPLAGPRRDVDFEDVKGWYRDWIASNSHLAAAQSMDLNSFRELVDPWLKHDHGHLKK